jgi:microsomal epoxide hydrolase
LAKLDRPVLYAITPPLKAQAEMLKARLPKARVELFEDCGHALFVDDAARFNKLLAEFLGAVR